MELTQLQIQPERFSAWVQQGDLMREAVVGADAVLVISRVNGKVQLSSTMPKEKAYDLVLSFIEEFRRASMEPASDTLMRVLPPAPLRGESMLPDHAISKPLEKPPSKNVGGPE